MLKELLSVIGDIFVVQPTFIFSSPLQSVDIKISNLTESVSVESLYSGEYFTGAGLCFYAAAAGSVANVIQVLVTRDDVNKVTSQNHFICFTGFIINLISSTYSISWCSGVWSVLISIACVPLISNVLLTSPGSMSLMTVSMLLVSSLITLLAVWTMVTAVSLTQNPTLVTMLQSLEIILAMMTESIYWGHPPDPLSAAGSIMVAMRQESIGTWCTFLF